MPSTPRWARQSLRLVTDCSAVPRVPHLRGMPTALTLVACGALCAALIVLTWLGTWDLATWWSALSAWAPFGAVVTLVLVVGWQLQLVHTALGAAQLVRDRTACDAAGGSAWPVIVGTWLAGSGWFVGTVLLPGM